MLHVCIRVHWSPYACLVFESQYCTTCVHRFVCNEKLNLHRVSEYPNAAVQAPSYFIWPGHEPMLWVNVFFMIGYFGSKTKEYKFLLVYAGRSGSVVGLSTLIRFSRCKMKSNHINEGDPYIYNLSQHILRYYYYDSHLLTLPAVGAVQIIKLKQTAGVYIVDGSSRIVVVHQTIQSLKICRKLLRL